MKHTRIFFALAALSAVFSCAKEEPASPVENGEKGLVPMTVSAGLETKTYVSGTDIIWEDTDDLAIFDGTAKRVFSISNISGTTADFSGEVADGSTEFYAAYPAASASALSAGVLTASLPSAQVIPAGKNLAVVPARSELPTSIQPALLDELKGTLLASIDSALTSVRVLVDNVNGQLEGDKLKNILANADAMVASLKVSSVKLERIMGHDIPAVMQQVDSILVDVKKLSANVSEADIAALVARADSAIADVNALIQAANSTDGTVGKLLHDNSLYDNINGTILTADSLMQDIREQPNSLIWGKKKKKK